MLFSIRSVEYVITPLPPSISHILFGITLLLHNLLLSVCQQIDRESNTGNESLGDDGQREWLQRSMVLSEEN